MIHKMWRRADIQERSVTRVKGVKTDNGWATLETVYCSLDPLTSRESRIADQNGMTVTHRVMMRWRSDLGDSNVQLQPKHQLVIDGQTYDVKSVVNVDERDKFAEVMVEERV